MDYRRAAAIGDEDATLACGAITVGQGERRMQVRAYNYWIGLQGGRPLPAIHALDCAALPGFGPHAVLLRFAPAGASAADDPGPTIAWLGSAIAEECGAAPGTLVRLADAPAGSLLARVAGHHHAIANSGAPAGFEAEFIGLRGATMLYRGILLPFSADGTTPDHVLAVINWKELAGEQLEAQIAREMRQVLGQGSVSPAGAPTLTDWADGPAADVGPPPVDAADALVLLLVRRDPAGGDHLLGEIRDDATLIGAAVQRIGL